MSFFKCQNRLLRGYRQSGVKRLKDMQKWRSHERNCQTLPGYRDRSTRDADGFAITVSYWESEEAIKGWREHAKHAISPKDRQRAWYEDYGVLRVVLQGGTAVIL